MAAAAVNSNMVDGFLGKIIPLKFAAPHVYFLFSHESLSYPGLKE